MLIEICWGSWSKRFTRQACPVTDRLRVWQGMEFPLNYTVISPCCMGGRKDGTTAVGNKIFRSSALKLFAPIVMVLVFIKGLLRQATEAMALPAKGRMPLDSVARRTPIRFGPKNLCRTLYDSIARGRIGVCRTKAFHKEEALCSLVGNKKAALITPPFIVNVLTRFIVENRSWRKGPGVLPHAIFITLAFDISFHFTAFLYGAMLPSLLGGLLWFSKFSAAADTKVFISEEVRNFAIRDRHGKCDPAWLLQI